MKSFELSSKPLVVLAIICVALLCAAVSPGVDARMHYGHLRHHRNPCIAFCRGFNCTIGYLKPFTFDCECAGCHKHSNYNNYKLSSILYFFVQHLYSNDQHSLRTTSVHCLIVETYLVNVEFEIDNFQIS